MNSRLVTIVGFVALASVLSMMKPVHADARLDCTLDYSLRGWSLVYKHAEGEGTVSCDNGQSMPVKVSAKAIGLTAGKWRIDSGRGQFSDIHDIDDVLGSYAQASASAGAGHSSEAQVVTKGTVSLALAGKGEGVNLGVDIGKFTIQAVK